MTSLWAHLRTVLAGGTGDGAADPLAAAVAALLVEAARIDGRIADFQRETIGRVLRRGFSLSDDDSARLVAAAEGADAATQLFPYTHAVVRHLAPEDRVQVVEMLWETAYADGTLSPAQDTLIRSVAGLIDVSDRDRGDARRRVLDRLGLAT